MRIRHLVERGAAVVPLVLVASAMVAPASAGHSLGGGLASATSDGHITHAEHSGQSSVGRSGSQAGALRDLAVARLATARFHHIEVAQAAGWETDVTGCLDFPNGYEGFGPGAMGHHYLNVEYYTDGGELHPAKPEALLYETQADGSMKLTAVEYIVPAADRPKTDPPPVMFGREMMFHDDFNAWALHVWLWKPNPYGLFADVNPRVSCEFAESA